MESPEFPGGGAVELFVFRVSVQGNGKTGVYDCSRVFKIYFVTNDQMILRESLQVLVLIVLNGYFTLGTLHLEYNTSRIL